jgi:hypothetical protein
MFFDAFQRLPDASVAKMRDIAQLCRRRLATPAGSHHAYLDALQLRILRSAVMKDPDIVLVTSKASLRVNSAVLCRIRPDLSEVLIRSGRFSRLANAGQEREEKVQQVPLDDDVGVITEEDLQHWCVGLPPQFDTFKHSLGRLSTFSRLYYTQSDHEILNIQFVSASPHVHRLACRTP